MLDSVRLILAFLVRPLTNWVSQFRKSREIDEDLDRIYAVLNDLNAIPLAIGSLHSVEDVLTKVVAYTPTTKKYQDRWLTFNPALETIHTLLNTYRSNLEHATRIPDHRCFTPTQEEEKDLNIPEYFQEPLHQLCRQLASTTLLLKSSRHLRLWRKSLTFEDLQQCERVTSSCLETIQTCITPKVIYHEPLNTNEDHDAPLDIMKNATPQRYRLIDCLQLTKHQILSICEFTHFPHVRYSAVSYVWRGNAVPEGYKAAEFSVLGAEEADPIGIEVLNDTCMAALAKGATHVWIDRLCIMQTSKEVRINAPFHIAYCFSSRDMSLDIAIARADTFGDITRRVGRQNASTMVDVP
ncbi:hypothetical protein QCA50_004857 [Cerrena zonata]|uniref:Heterokaryon incompatibility domain-containing protein n=1 Tax=Cerrena zonata TaxID=2478898 RepID=A0AAW0GMN6_9APHY